MATCRPVWLLMVLAVGGSPAAAQRLSAPAGDSAAASPAPPGDPAARRARAEAERARGLHLVISRAERRLWLRDGGIVLYSAPVAVGKGTTLAHEGRRWSFDTPAGRRTVLAKADRPVWVPPDWHYVELAREHGYALARLERDREAVLSDGSRLAVRGDRVAWIHADGRVEVLPPGEEIIVGGTLYVPPFGTANRPIPDELGRHKLDLGDGYLIHGTPREDEIGQAVTHGCIRLRAEDLSAVYGAVPVGTPVFIY